MGQVPDRLLAPGMVDDQAAGIRFLDARRWTRYEPWAYLIALSFAEVVSDIWQPLIGLCLHALLATVLILRGSQLFDAQQGRLCIAMSILPLVRIVSFAISPSFATGVWFYVAAELPLLGAALAAARVLGFTWSDIGFRRPRSWLLSAGVLVSGLGAGWVEAQIIHPAALASSLSMRQALLPAVLLILSTGLVEEVVFRGLLQLVSSRVMGPVIGVSFTALGWGILHIGSLSVIDVAYVFLIGLMWGWFRQVNRSVLDIGLAHGLANIMLFIVVPNLRF